MSDSASDRMTGENFVSWNFDKLMMGLVNGGKGVDESDAPCESAGAGGGPDRQALSSNNGENEWLKIVEPSRDRPQVRFGILASPDPGALPGTGNFAWRRSRHLTLPTGLDPPFPNII